MDSQEGGVSYEDARKQRLEENKKRMQELGLADLSKDLSNGVAASKPTPQARQAKPRIPKEFVEIRRSSRVASNPAPDYREVDADSSLGRRSYSHSSRASSLLNRKYASDEARLEAALQAESIMKELPRRNPSFVKPMLQSHVTGGFWLGLPSMFCKSYLPHKDDKIVLENEKGDEWDTVFLANKAGLSGGWRGFSLDHGLVDGDALVFELVEPRRFKIHIVRASEEAQDEEDESGGVRAKATIVQKYKVKKQEDLEEAEPPQKAKTKKKQATKQQALDDVEEESKEEPEKKASSKKEASKKKKRKAKDEDLEGLFEIEEEDIAEPTDSTQITSFLRAGKPHLDRASKKPMTCGNGISVC